MGYYSEVAIGLSKKGYNELKALCSKNEFILDSADEVYSNPSGDKFIFIFESYNHWGTEPKSEAIINKLNLINDKGYGYNIVSIGEEVADINYEVVSGTNNDEDFNIVSVVSQVYIDDEDFVKFI